MLRDTDEDWRGIAGEPFWGVFTNRKWLRHNLTEESLKEFWDTGCVEVDASLNKLRRHFGDFRPRTAIDFGCGVGRLTRAIGRYVESAVGVDVAKGMIDEARKWGEAHIDYRLGLPDVAADWINSSIVFQHIHPEAGFALLSQLLELLNSGGGISLHFGLFKDRSAFDHATSGLEYFAWDGVGMKTLIETPPGLGSMMMYDYDLNKIIAILNRVGIEQLIIEHTNHGGNHGAYIYGRKTGSLI